MLRGVVGTSPLIGREAELADLGELVAANRLVTITGPGGVGKTRLAAELAGTVLPAMVDDRAVELRLTDLEPDADESLVSSLLGLASPEAVAFSLGEIGSFVLLDNCEHVLDGAAGFVTRLLS